MRSLRVLRLIAFFASLSLLAPLHARAAGLITALTASANPVNVNTDVTFTVKGTSGGCGDLTIDYGDGQTAQLVSVSFNNNTNTTTPAHKYGVAKTYVVKAIPGKSCTGAASVNLAVTAPPSGGGGIGTGAFSQLAKRNSVANIARLFAPQIINVFPFSAIRPGGGVIVQGEHFGTAPGRFQLKLAGGLTTDLTRLEWGDKAIGGTIDPGISGVVDQPAMLQIIRSNGQVSNEVPVTFTARREIKLLPMGDLHADCSSGSDRNKCNETLSTVSVVGWHGCTGIYFSCSDAGKDEYWATLANGWSYSSSTVMVGLARADQPLVLQDDPGAFRLSVYWDTQGRSFATYNGNVFVEGPAGTSWK